MNPGEIVGNFLDRFRLSQGWNLKMDEAEQAEHDLRIQVFLESLGAARIEPKHYDALYRRAIATRGRKKGEGVAIPYHVTPEEIIAEYAAYQADLIRAAEEGTGAPKTAVCSVTHDDEADRLVYYFIGGKDVLLPCHECRKDAHTARKTGRIKDKQLNRPRLPAPGETVGEKVSNLPTKSNVRAVAKNMHDPAEILRQGCARAVSGEIAAETSEERENLRRLWGLMYRAIYRISEQNAEVNNEKI